MNIKYYLMQIRRTVIGCSLIFVSCGVESQKKDSDLTTDKTTSPISETSINDTTPKKNLNDIRFGNWTEEDWCDNEYLLELRSYLDKIYIGEAHDENLQEYKSLIHSKFVVYKVEPYLLGGLYVQIVFLDAPDKIFEGHVYSYVDEDKEMVLGYEVRGLRLSTVESHFTKGQILDLLTEHSEMKLF